MIYVLDSNTLIYFFKGMGRVRTRLREIDPSSIAIPTVVLFELHVNLIKNNSRGKFFRFVEDFSENSIILPLDQTASICAANVRARLEKIGRPIGPMDVLIAGTAMASEATLVTHNTREFSRVDGLLLEDWF